MTTQADSLLTIEDLRVKFRTGAGIVDAVKGISFAMGREKLGIVGESGSGKSITGRAILRLVPPNGQVSATQINFDGTELSALDNRAMRACVGGGSP